MIAVLVYETPHRRSQEILLRLAASGTKATVIVLDFERRKNFEPIYKHRPGPLIQIPTAHLSMNLGFETVVSSHHNLRNTLERFNPEYILLGGARLIDTEITERFTIINSHPAYLPYNRGLDALKWAIYTGTPIGVTTHVIDGQIDAGKLIDQKIIAVKQNEDFWSLATRVFQTECEMMITALDAVKTAPLELLATNDAPNRRMPHKLEIVMMERFKDMRMRANNG